MSHFTIPQYDLYHTNHPSGSAHGGTAILIRCKINHYETDKFSTEYLQATTIIVQDSAGQFAISSIYCPPKHPIKCQQFIKYFESLGRRFIAGGDYNAKHTFWGSRLITTKGRELIKSIEDMNLETISTGEPTYWPTDRRKVPDVIDFAVSKGLDMKKIIVKSSLELSSDHSPIIINISDKIRANVCKPKLHTAKTNWDTYRAKITATLPTNISLKSDKDIINAVDLLNSCIVDAARGATPPTKSTHANLNPYDIPTPIRELIAKKREVRKQWQKHRSPQLKKKLNSYIKLLKAELKEHREAEIQKHLISLDSSSTTENSLWRATAKLKRPKIPNPPIRTANDDWARSDSEKAEAFAKHLSKVFTPNPKEVSEEQEQFIMDTLNATPKHDSPIKPFSKNEISQTVRRNIDIKKSPGYDLITGKCLMELPQVGIDYLTYLFNAVLRLSFYPPQWKRATIIMLAKPGKPPEECKSYRPISLLPIVSKIFEKLFLHRLLPIIDKSNTIPQHQFGFRQKHSTVEQVHRLVQEINHNFETKKYCSAVFLDVAQAFDRVWHEGLLYKLKTYLPPNCFTVLKSYLHKRQFQIKQGNEISEQCEASAGVPQGSVLGPLLYLLFTADIPVTSEETIVATYADDTAILVSHKDPVIATKKLQNELNKISHWLQIWRIKVNETKSAHVTFTLRHSTCPPVGLNGVQIPQQEDTKYLGMHLDRKLTWRKHIFTKRKQLGLQLRKLYWLIGHKSKLSMDNKLLIYKSILKPIWTYGIQLWGTASRSNMEILQRFQNKILRTISRAPWFVPNAVLHRDLHIATIEEETKLQSRKYSGRLTTHPNKLATTLMSKKPMYRRLKRRIPQDLIAD